MLPHTPRLGADKSAPVPRTRQRAAEPAVDRAAADWQIILHLRALAERDPDCVAGLLDGIEHQSTAYAELLYAAVREALATHPLRADLHYQCAWAAVFAQQRAEAVPLLTRCLELAPEHAAARSLLQRIDMGGR